MRAGVEGQQQQFEKCLAAVRARGGDAGDRAQRLVGDDRGDLLDLAAARISEQRRKAPVLEVGPCERADAGSSNPEREAEMGLSGQDEDVPEQAANGGRIDIGPVRGALHTALLVPIREELAARRMFHV